MFIVSFNYFFYREYEQNQTKNALKKVSCLCVMYVPCFVYKYISVFMQTPSIHIGIYSLTLKHPISPQENS